MVEYIRLDPFIFFPYFIPGEEINLDGNTIFRGLKLADNLIQILIYDRKTCQITLYIYTEYLGVCRYYILIRLVIR